jgi:hypothetical protein
MKLTDRICSDSLFGSSKLSNENQHEKEESTYEVVVARYCYFYGSDLW